MNRLVAEALLYLMRTEWYMQRHGIEPLHDHLSRLPSSSEKSHRSTSQQICRAADIACVLYFKRVLCLQRSAATTMLLRKYGYPAEFVIGARIIPFKSHAWVELDGSVINDKPYISQLYRELERVGPALDSGRIQ
jgi:prolyl oligopeptidase